MEALASSEVFLFDGFRLDRRGGGLFRRDDSGAFAPVAIGSRGLDILRVLIARAGEVVSKDEIIAAVWPGIVVEESNLTVQISALRRLLDRDRTQGSCIQTVPGRGYRFVATVAAPAAEPQSAPSLVDDAPAAGAPSAIGAGPQQRLSRPLLGAAAPTRRLAAILALDVAGYSRLMGIDEEGTYERLKVHNRQLVEPKIREHQGRIVKTAGDGMLAEFHSVVDAVRCAAEIQRGMIDREPQLFEDQRIKFRIGINLGDVIAERGDIFGDGVNVAARLEALAEPGGICVSGVVRDQIRDKLPYQFEDMGEQSVKNIARPVRVYALRPEAIADLPVSRIPSAVPRRRRAIGIAITAAVAVALVLAGAWRLWPAAKPSAAPEIMAATSISQPLVAPRLSMVVLPFANLSNDPEKQYLADGVTEDITTDLSRIPIMFVIARSTAFTYRNKSADPKQIGRELGVRYVLEGSVQILGSRLRITAQLIDTETNAHIWAERFDRDAADLYDLQNEITGRITAALNLELIATEAARRTTNPDALDYILRGQASLRSPFTRASYAETIGLFERALALDPRSAEAQSRLADVLSARVMTGWATSAEADLARAEELAEQALAASPRNAQAHFARAQVRRARRQYAEAIPEYETALALNRNIVAGWHALAICKLFTGSIEETIPLEEQAIRLSPRDPYLYLFHAEIGLVHLLQSRTDEAIHWLESARDANPAPPQSHIRLASAYGLKGQTELAAVELAEARRRANEGSFSSITQMKAGLPPSASSKIVALFDATFFAGLRKAGIPEE